MQKSHYGSNFTKWFHESVWVATYKLVCSNNNKVIDDKVNKIKHRISHIKITCKSPRFETFKTEESNISCNCSAIKISSNDSAI